MMRPGLLAFALILTFATMEDAWAGNTASANSLLFLSRDDLAQLKMNLKAPDPDVARYARVLRKAAKSALKRGPWSVTDQRAPSREAEVNDFYSESPYWWPDPQHPMGSYIRKDGVRNPRRFTAHKEALVAFTQATFVLSAAAYLFDDDRYAERAKHLIEIWFLNPRTRMNPHARFAQVIPQSTQKRGVGIIDTRHLIYVIESIELLRLANSWSDERDAAVRTWFKEYLNWLLTSEYGRDERTRGNNHSSWYALQVAAYGAYVGDAQVVRETCRYGRDSLIARQIARNGSQPFELERTRALDYSLFNLDALALLARLAERENEDLWHWQNQSGQTMIGAIDYIVPYFDNPRRWPYAQLTTYQRQPRIFLCLAGEALKRPDLTERFMTASPDKYIEEPLIFLAGMLTVSRNQR